MPCPFEVVPRNLKQRISVCSFASVLLAAVSGIHYPTPAPWQLNIIATPERARAHTWHGHMGSVKPHANASELVTPGSSASWISSGASRELTPASGGHAGTTTATRQRRISVILAGFDLPVGLFPNLLAGNSAGSQKAVSRVQEAGVKPFLPAEPDERRPGYVENSLRRWQLQVHSLYSFTHCRTTLLKVTELTEAPANGMRKRRRCRGVVGKLLPRGFPTKGLFRCT
jgi:hypothetical protein